MTRYPRFGGQTDPSSRGAPAENRRPSISSRVVPVVMTALGVVIVAATQAVQRGILTGVAIDWPAYIFGGVLIVLGLIGVGRGDGEASPIDPRADADRDDVSFEGRTPFEGKADEKAELRALLERIERERRQRYGRD